MTQEKYECCVFVARSFIHEFITEGNLNKKKHGELFELFWKMELEDKKKLYDLLNTKEELIETLFERIKLLEDELEEVINKHNAEKLTGNVTIKCDTVNIYG